MSSMAFGPEFISEISESGMAGKDVDIEGVDENGGDAGDDEAEDDGDGAADGETTDDENNTTSTDSRTPILKTRPPEISVTLVFS